jgi:uncharacterized repeat protein (TIGR03803 family)
LVQGNDGNYYGTTYGGGELYCYLGCGTIFSVTPGGTLTTLYTFCATNLNCPEGENPQSGLVLGNDGNFYGASYWGGSNQDGTIYQVTPSGSLTILHTFCTEGCADGYHPSGLILASDGNLYGTTQFGGAHGDGTIFRITTYGALTTVYNFCSQVGCVDGSNPISALVEDTGGNLYGTTTAGGANNYGTVFKLAAALRKFVQPQPAAGKPGATIDILGTDLTGATSVTFNGKSASFTVVSKSEVTATVPAGAATGPVEVATPQGNLTSSFSFRVLR